MASFYLRDSAAWRKIQKLYMNDGAAWRAIKKLYMMDGGAWRLVYSGFQIVWSGAVLSFEATSIAPAAAQVFLFLNSDGSWNETPDSATGSWGTPNQAGIGANYWVKYVQVSGSAPNTSPAMSAGTWYQLNTARRYGQTRGGTVGSTTSTIDVYISTTNSDAGIVASRRLILTATVDS